MFVKGEKRARIFNVGFLFGQGRKLFQYNTNDFY